MNKIIYLTHRLRRRAALLAVLGAAGVAWALGASHSPQPARALAVLDTFTYLPVVMKSGCSPVPGATYGTLPPTNPNGGAVEDDHRINIALRGREPVNQTKGLVTFGGTGDPLAPQFPGLFGDDRTPVFSEVYAVHRWDDGCNCPLPDLVTNPAVTVAGLETAPDEIIYTPNSGYDIGGGNDALVLYASPTHLTLKYTREDDVVSGYTVYLLDVCVEPSLLALYQAQNAAGRGELPVLTGGQPLGRALGNEIGVAVRDSGTFQDPRSRNSWWQGR